MHQHCHLYEVELVIYPIDSSLPETRTIEAYGNDPEAAISHAETSIDGTMSDVLSVTEVITE